MEKNGIYVVVDGEISYIEKDLPDFCKVTIQIKDGKVIHGTAEESLKIEHA